MNFFIIVNVKFCLRFAAVYNGWAFWFERPVNAVKNQAAYARHADQLLDESRTELDIILKSPCGVNTDER
jgi:hypothetical protein